MNKSLKHLIGVALSSSLVFGSAALVSHAQGIDTQASQSTTNAQKLRKAMWLMNISAQKSPTLIAG